jgi:diadenylate cyclase
VPTEPKDWLEIFLIFLLVYFVFRFMQGTIAGAIVRGPGFLLTAAVIGVLVLLGAYGLDTIRVILQYLLGVFLVGLIIVFQPELRRGLLKLGHSAIISRFVARDSHVIDEVVKASLTLAKDRIGALIAFEGDVDLGSFVAAGVPLNADVKAELIDTIFWPGSALHDGAIVIREDRIAAGSCLFPLTENPEVSRHLGTRHRAAIGLTEETDAICVVVSEETGSISVAEGGDLTRDYDEEGLRARLRETFRRGAQP